MKWSMMIMEGNEIKSTEPFWSYKNRRCDDNGEM